MFIKITEASKEIGITYNELRNGINEGRYPFIKRGCAYWVDIEMILEELRKEAMQNRRNVLDRIEIEGEEIK